VCDGVFAAGLGEDECIAAMPAKITVVALSAVKQICSGPTVQFVVSSIAGQTI
jgi:hypothetical protein